MRDRRIWARLFFSHIAKALRIAKTQQLELSDLPTVPFELGETAVFDQSKPLWRGLLKKQRRHILWLLLLIGAVVAVKIRIPFAIRQTIELLQGQMTRAAWLQAALEIGGLQIVAAWIAQQYQHRLILSQQSLLHGLLQLMMHRMQSLTAEARRILRPGYLSSLIGHDADCMAVTIRMASEILYAFVLIIAAGFSLWELLGPSCWPVIVVYGITLFILQKTSRVLVRRYSHLLQSHDNRLTHVLRVLRSLPNIKAEVVEETVEKHVDEAVQATEKNQRRFLSAKCFMMILQQSAAFAAPALTFFVMSLNGLALDKATLFSSLAVLALLDGPISHLVNNLSELLTAGASMRRMRDLWRLPVHSWDKISQEKADIMLQDLHVAYGDKVALNHINLTFKAGEAVAVVGASGSGKSTLLSALMQETPYKGAITYSGLHTERPKVAYVPHEPFTIRGSLQENIFLGQKRTADDDWMRQCAFSGDLLHIGTKHIEDDGVGVSGGQRQRIALARARVAEADVMLLDDPTAALDPITEKQIYDRLLFGAWAAKIRIIVTSRLRHLQRFDRIVALDKGEVVFDGNWGAYSQWCGNCASDEDPLITHEETKQAVRENSQQTSTEKEHLPPITKHAWSFVKSLKGAQGIGRLLLGCVLVVASPQLQNLWLAFGDRLLWVKSIQEQAAWSVHISIYAILGILGVLFTTMNYRRWLIAGAEIARTLHRQSVRGIVRGQLPSLRRYHTGEWTARFLKDYIVVEQQWMSALLSTCMQALNGLSQMIIVAFFAPATMVVLLPALCFYYVLQKSYRGGLKQSQRLLGETRATMLAKSREWLQSTTTLQDVANRDFFQKRFLAALQDYHTAFIGMTTMNRWFSLRVPLCGASLFAAMAIVPPGDSVPMGFLALSVLTLAERLEGFIRSAGDLSSQASAWQRLAVFAELPAEDSGSAEGQGVHAIEMKDVTAAYGNGRPILKNFSLSIKSGEHIGIVGPSGCGKSTLLQLVMKFVGAQQGNVFINGINVHDWDTKSLRRSLAYIPQDPMLFSGTLRKQFDPDGSLSDQQIERRLESFGLSAILKRYEDGLNTMIDLETCGLSRGERQILCLARALVGGKKLLVIDEATANLDDTAESMVVMALARCRGSVIALMVAHKSEALRECDRVIHLAHGKVLESKTKRPKKVVEELSSVRSAPQIGVEALA